MSIRRSCQAVELSRSVYHSYQIAKLEGDTARVLQIFA